MDINKKNVKSALKAIDSAKACIKRAEEFLESADALYAEDREYINHRLESTWNDLDDYADNIVRVALGVDIDVVNEKWSDDPDNDLWKRNSDGTFQRDEKGNKIPVSFKDDLNDLKAKLSSLSSDVKAKIAAFLFGDKVATAVAESSDEGKDVLTGDEEWIPQDLDEVSEKAEGIRADLDTLVEKIAALQIYCAEHTEDRCTHGYVSSIYSGVQSLIDAIDILVEKKQCDDGDDDEIVVSDEN